MIARENRKLLLKRTWRLLIGAALLCSCDREPGAVSTIDDLRWYPVAWEDSSTIIAIGVVASTDAGSVRCIDAGFFNISLTDSTFSETRSSEHCALFRNADWPSVRPSRHEIIFGVPDRSSGFALIDSAGAVHYVHRQCRNVRTPSWTSDGLSVIFTGACGEDAQAYSIAIAGVFDTSYRQVSGVASIAPLSYATMNSAKELVALTRGHLGVGASVLVVDVESGREVAVWPGTSPSWHPSLDVLAYFSFDDERDPLLSVRDVSGLNHSVVWRPDQAGSVAGFHLHPIGPPLWSSDGASLAFSLGESVVVVDVRSQASLMLRPSKADGSWISTTVAARALTASYASR